jgi:predicted alpha/beta superfamily hydrolase
MTEDDVESLGIRLSNEVISYIRENCPGNTVTKMSFIGHSLGGLIIRTALIYLADYSHLFDQYMSLSSPHIGYM